MGVIVVTTAPVVTTGAKVVSIRFVCAGVIVISALIETVGVNVEKASAVLAGWTTSCNDGALIFTASIALAGVTISCSCGAKVSSTKVALAG